jgi:hypothetical protein
MMTANPRESSKQRTHLAYIELLGRPRSSRQSSRAIRGVSRHQPAVYPASKSRERLQDQIERRLSAISCPESGVRRGFTIWAAKNNTGRIIHGKPASAISGHPDIPCFLLLDDPANELFLSVGLGADRILAPLGGSSNRIVGN